MDKRYGLVQLVGQPPFRNSHAVLSSGFVQKARLQYERNLNCQLAISEELGVFF